MKPAELFDLSGKVAVVTGGGSGLGQVFCEVFADAGAKVVVTDREEERAHEVALGIRGTGGDAIAHRLDVSVIESVESLGETLQAEYGRIDILVNNAGIATVAHRVHELPLDAWQDVIDINLTGTFYCTRTFLPLMLEKGGSIVNISSILGLVGVYPDTPMVNSPYAAAKAGVIGLTRQTAVEYAKDNIRCNAIAPGWHGGTKLGDANRRHRSNSEIAQFEDAVLNGTPMGRRGVPSELAGLALYLASDASSYVTGQVMTQDGGWTAA